MFVIKRNQVVVTALAVMIAAAGYLNFQEAALPKESDGIAADRGRGCDGVGGLFRSAG